MRFQRHVKVNLLHLVANPRITSCSRQRNAHTLNHHVDIFLHALRLAVAQIEEEWKASHVDINFLVRHNSNLVRRRGARNTLHMQGRLLGRRLGIPRGRWHGRRLGIPRGRWHGRRVGIHIGRWHGRRVGIANGCWHGRRLGIANGCWHGRRLGTPNGHAMTADGHAWHLRLDCGRKFDLVL